MIEMIEPEISSDFTVEDIHRIREYDAERRRILGDEAFWAEVHADSLYMQEKIKESRERRLERECDRINKAI
jgi:hypothetical protein